MTTGRQPLLRLEHVDKIYRSGEVEVVALQDTCLDIQTGEFLVVIGPSGSGKSTLLNLLGGMDRPTHGHVWFQGQDLATASDRQLTRYRRSQVGFVFQFFNLVPTLTALENVQVATEIAVQPMPAEEALRIVGLAERATSFPSQLSGGQQQRVAIARALASRPHLLLCDEPTGNLDSKTGRQVLEMLTKLNQEMHITVVVITHHSAVSQIANRVAEIKDGKIVSLAVNAVPRKVSEVEW